MTGRFGRVAALAALIVVAGASAADARAPKAPRGFYGLSSQTHLEGTDFRLMARGGVGTLRVAFPWVDVDIIPPASEEEFFTPRPYRWTVIDPTVRKAAKRGIRILPTVYGTPTWVANYQGCQSNCHKVGPSTIQAYFAFAMFMRAAVQRYGPNGAFWAEHPNLPYRPIGAWEIWNEQNSSDFWKPAPSIEAYAGLISVAGDVVHAVDPAGQVIVGGMFHEPAQAGKVTIPGWDFLTGLYSDPNARESFDGLGIHPYSVTARQLNNVIVRWRQEMQANGMLGQTSIWVTELGWATGGGRHPLNLGLRGQARALRESLGYLLKNRRRYDIEQVVIFSWRDFGPGYDPCGWCKKSGLVRYRGRRAKPAWNVFRDFTGTLAAR